MAGKPILVVSGTNRPDSNAMRVARVLEGHYRAAQTPVEVLSLTELPREVFDGAAYATKPDGMVKIQQRVLDAPGLHVVTPEYNGSFPGVPKYFIDMLKFPESFHASPSPSSGNRWARGGAAVDQQLIHIFLYRNWRTITPSWCSSRRSTRSSTPREKLTTRAPRAAEQAGSRLRPVRRGAGGGGVRVDPVSMAVLAGKVYVRTRPPRARRPRGPGLDRLRRNDHPPRHARRPDRPLRRRRLVERRRGSMAGGVDRLAGVPRGGVPSSASPTPISTRSSTACRSTLASCPCWNCSTGTRSRAVLSDGIDLFIRRRRAGWVCVGPGAVQRDRPRRAEDVPPAPARGRRVRVRVGPLQGVRPSPPCRPTAGNLSTSATAGAICARLARWMWSSPRCACESDGTGKPPVHPVRHAGRRGDVLGENVGKEDEVTTDAHRYTQIKTNGEIYCLWQMNEAMYWSFFVSLRGQ